MDLPVKITWRTVCYVDTFNSMKVKQNRNEFDCKNRKTSVMICVESNLKAGFIVFSVGKWFQ